MRSIHIPAILCVFFFFCIAPSIAWSTEISCESDLAECTLSETRVSCDCKYIGAGTDGGGDIEFEVSEEACQSHLPSIDRHCLEFTPTDSCESEKGECEVFQDRIKCHCARGGSENGRWEEGKEALDCKTFLYISCLDPPDEADYCDSEAQSFCQETFDFLSECTEFQLWDWMITSCCWHHDQNKSGLEDLWDCIQTAGCENWYSDCQEGEQYPLIFEIPDSASDGEGDEGSNDETNGCSTGGTGEVYLLAIALAALVRRKRRSESRWG